MAWWKVVGDGSAPKRAISLGRALDALQLAEQYGTTVELGDGAREDALELARAIVSSCSRPPEEARTGRAGTPTPFEERSTRRALVPASTTLRQRARRAERGTRTTKFMLVLALASRLLSRRDMRPARLRASLVLVSSDRETLARNPGIFPTDPAPRASAFPRSKKHRAQLPVPDAAVIFADGIPEDALARAASELPVKLVVVVTREVERIREVLWARRAQARVLVLPRLAGWTLVEVVRRSLPEPSRLALR